jgi:hypothetical protein
VAERQSAPGKTGRAFDLVIMSRLVSSHFRHCEEQGDEAIHSAVRALDCFAALAMTI